MTTFNEAVQVAEAAHRLTLHALDKALLNLVKAAGVEATKVSVDLRDRIATGDAFVNRVWVPLKINMGVNACTISIDGTVCSITAPELLAQVCAADSMLTHAQALLDAVHEGLLSDDE